MVWLDSSEEAASVNDFLAIILFLLFVIDCGYDRALVLFHLFGQEGIDLALESCHAGSETCDVSGALFGRGRLWTGSLGVLKDFGTCSGRSVGSSEIRHCDDGGEGQMENVDG
jgi:hypothetical protein